MPERQPQRLYDGFAELSRGVHSGRAKTLLSNSHAAFAVNTTFRGDKPTNRPGWKKINLDLSSVSGRFQGAAIHESLSDDAHLLVAAGGSLYRIEVTPFTPTVEDITLSDPNNPNIQQNWFCQVPGYTIIQDGEQRAMIYSGAGKPRRATTNQREVPTGTVMAYGNGRLWVALPDGRAFVASDLLYGDGSIESVLRFTENEVVFGGGAFGVPVEAGDIRAMAFVGIADTSTGQGPLLVFTERSVFSVNSPYERSDWAAVTSPIQTVILPNGGATGPHSVAQVNGDLWYRDRHGIRSFKTAYRDWSNWANTVQSRAVNRVLTKDDRNLLRYCSIVEFDNRLLCTVTPQYDHDAGIYHKGLVVLDFDQVSDTDSLSIQQALPVWDGVWTGLRILQVLRGRFEGIDRCFMFAINDSDVLELWELTRDAVFDSDDNAIEWSVELPDYAFGNNMHRKELIGGKLWLRDVHGDVTVTTQFKPDAYPIWQDWDSVELCATVNAPCDDDACTGTPRVPQPRSPVPIPRPTRACLSGQANPNNVGYTFSPKITVTGHCVIDRFRAEAQPTSDDRDTRCPADETCTTIETCAEDYYNYETQE